MGVAELAGRLLFYVQLLLLVQCIAGAAAVGILASPLLLVARRRPAVNWAAAQAMRVLAEHVLGITVDVDGAEHLLRAGALPCVIVANHQSLLDAVWLAWVLPRRAVVVASTTIARLPVLGWFMRLAGNLFVRRGDGQSVKALFDSSLRYLEREKTTVVMFPEGRRNPTRTGALLDFKKGAFYLAYCVRAPIIPVAVQCLHPIYSWSDRRFRRNCVIRIRVLPPIPTHALAEEAIPALVADVRNDIQKACISLASAASHRQLPQEPPDM
ncbi:1-acylglycerol-3-phosphate O-acyltransferase [Coemansia biformis]|uniref:1-acylglycerol-3-phosphate O-acyltransferase n=1 Tax=Coemansia biformis TaxID=1286918 RepID=A0A9W7YJ83_9FUNG|nr:1-acylglycerol-3-phosphate O-acyltransferase [Coemansia biformis]